MIKDILSLKMRKFGVRSAIFTSLSSYRRDLITKEEVKRKYRLEDEDFVSEFISSVYDDLESFYYRILYAEEKTGKRRSR